MTQSLNEIPDSQLDICWTVHGMSDARIRLASERQRKKQLKFA
jgi:hypothetical protein